MKMKDVPELKPGSAIMIVGFVMAKLYAVTHNLSETNPVFSAMITALAYFFVFISALCCIAILFSDSEE